MERTPPKTIDGNWLLTPSKLGMVAGGSREVYLPNLEAAEQQKHLLFQQQVEQHQQELKQQMMKEDEFKSMQEQIAKLQQQLLEQQQINLENQQREQFSLKLQQQQQPQQQQLKQIKEQQQKQQQKQKQQVDPEISGKTDKRKRSSPGQAPALKQLKLKESWLNPPISTANRFISLIDDEEVTTQTTTPTEIEPKTKPVKPPPIYVAGVGTLKPLNDELGELCNNNYSIKVINDHEVKVQTSVSDDYRAVVAKLTEKNTQFHSYKEKHLKNFRVVLRGLHSSTDTDDIKCELEALNHKVASVYNIKNRGDGRMLPLFYVDILPDVSNKDIYNIKYLMHTKIIVEAPHKKRDIPQCSRCQHYGHTHKYCNRDFRCVKCTGNHGTKECPRKTRDNNVKCVLCYGNHPANFKGCTHYKQIQERKFPPLRKKEISENRAPGFALSTNQFVQPNKTYAEMASGISKQPLNQPPLDGQSYYQSQTHQPQQQNYQQQQPQPNQNQSSDITDLKNMMKDLMGQISPLINLLTTLVARMK